MVHHDRDESYIKPPPLPATPELHIWLGEPQPHCTIRTLTNLQETQEAINKGAYVIHTTQPHVCDSSNLAKGYRIFAHMLDGETVEIKLGRIDNCEKQIRKEHNLAKMLLAGSFGKARI